MKGITIFNEGWVADCDVCHETIKYADTKRALMAGLRIARDRHLRSHCLYRDVKESS